MKIGSLFDGSGGFPLAASMCGIKPTWASEVEPYPIAVTRSRFPDMKHLGSVTEVRGDEVEPVDVITFGSPCQDLSVAGKRAGLKHTENGDEETTRSGLFMEAVRIIKEMRKATNGEYPRYAVWENVPGAFSSNKGLDFRVVLEELIRIAEPTAVMPEVPKAGWAYADVYCGDGWSLAYRVLDAQYWGVPQRRRRIYLVADFRGQRAGKILFEREGLRGYFAESGAQRKATAGDAESGIGADDREGKCYGISSYASNAMMSSNPHSGIYEADTARTLDLNGGNPACNQGGIAIVEPVACDIYNLAVTGDVATTLTTATGQGASNTGPSVCVPYTLKIRGGVEVDSAGKSAGKGALIQTNLSATLGVSQDQYLFQPILDDQGGSQISVRYDGKSPTLRAEMHGNVPCVVEAGGFKELNSAKARSDGFGYEVAPCLAANKHDACVAYSIENHPADSRVNIDESGKVQTLTSRMGTGGGNVPMVMEPVVFRKGTRPHSADEAQKWEEADVANTLNTFDQGEARANELVVDCQPIPMEGNGARPSHQGDGYSESDVMYTLNTIERHAVACAEAITVHGETISGTLMSRDYKGVGRWDSLDKVVCVADHVTPKIDENGVAYTLNARDYKDPQAVAYEQPIAIDRAFFNQGQNAQYDPQLYTDGTNPTLVARGPSAVAVRYIVRRLTPTECARLQGFPDEWGHPDIKTELTDEEYAFWLNVRNTHAEINGKATKDYTRDQMLTWYNKLHTDSAEYKLWGNGIALPCALYVMEGIANEN